MSKILRIQNRIKVVGFVLQLFFFLTSTSAQENVTISSPTVNNNNNNVTTPINITSQASNATKEIIALEGGSKIVLPTTPPVTATSQNHNREGVTTTPTVIKKISTTMTTRLATNKLISTTPTAVNVTIPLLTNVSELQEHKKITPRKGVNFTNAESTPKPKKPLITTASEDEPYEASHFQSKSKSNMSDNQSVPKVPNLNVISNESSESKTQKYVVPIVIVILSVPFVAILVSFVYKRGAEWWKYRHYRRMDFLINGMYDN